MGRHFVGALLVMAGLIGVGCNLPADSVGSEGSGLGRSGKGSTSPSGRKVASAQLSAAGTLTVTSPDITASQPIPERFSAYGANDTPTIRWTTPPTGTKSLLLLTEDPDAPGETPFVHWLVFNLPPTATEIGATLPAGVRVGANSTGEAGYFGPRPPSGLHHYHFQVFALDTTLTADAGANWEMLRPKVEGHVLAQGQLIGTYEKK